MTFGALKLAQSNLDDIINWVYSRNEPDAETFVDLVQKSIFEELINHIVGPNDLLRNQVKNSKLFNILLTYIYFLIIIIIIYLNI